MFELLQPRLTLIPLPLLWIQKDQKSGLEWWKMYSYTISFKIFFFSCCHSWQYHSFCCLIHWRVYKLSEDSKEFFTIISLNWSICSTNLFTCFLLHYVSGYSSHVTINASVVNPACPMWRLIFFYFKGINFRGFCHLPRNKILAKFLKIVEPRN